MFHSRKKRGKKLFYSQKKETEFIHSLFKAGVLKRTSQNKICILFYSIKLNYLHKSLTQIFF
jgi:hypothetical protein